MTVTSFILSLLAFFALFLPDIGLNSKQELAKDLSINEPKIVMTSVGIDTMHDGISKPEMGGYIIEKNNLGFGIDLAKGMKGRASSITTNNTPYQNYIMFSRNHEILFNLSNNNLYATQPIRIVNISLVLTDYLQPIRKPYFYQNDYGAGATEKIFRYDARKITEALTSSRLPVEINSIIDDENLEKWDSVVLSQQAPEDYFRLKIPLDNYGVIKFYLKIYYQYDSEELYFDTPSFLIANNEEASNLEQQDCRNWPRGTFECRP
jgi:hypothetical protein